ncbi:MAG: hypothetical protein M0Z91_13185 [Actinomycetota bacterium]|nr:hypothetical protein [Actinomycetota bacterium]
MKPAEGAKFEWLGRQRATGMIPVDDPALVAGGIAIYSRVSFAEQPARPGPPGTRLREYRDRLGCIG